MGQRLLMPWSRLRTVFAALSIGWLYTLGAAAQGSSPKLALGPDAYRNWPAVTEPRIAPNGRYVAYEIDGLPPGKHTLMVQALDDSWKSEVSDVEGGSSHITADSRTAVTLTTTGELLCIGLGNQVIDKVADVASYTVASGGGGKWLAYRPRGMDSTLVLRNMRTGLERRLTDVLRYQLDDDDRSVILTLVHRATPDGTGEAHRERHDLLWLDLESGRSTTLASDTEVGAVFVAPDGRQLAFITQVNDKGEEAATVWHFRAGAASPERLATNGSLGLNPQEHLSFEGFDADAHSIILRVRESIVRAPVHAELASVDVWSYRDEVLQSLQLRETPESTYSILIRLKDHRASRLRCSGAEMEAPILPSGDGEFALLQCSRGKADRSELSWNPKAQRVVELVSLIDGARTELPVPSISWAALSPQGRYVVFYDPGRREFFSYDIASKTMRCITAGLKTMWATSTDLATSGATARPLAGWMENDSGVLIYDRNDVWKVDPAGVNPPINVTRGYGKVHSIVFHLPDSGLPATYGSHDKVVITALNSSTKDNGYFEQRLDATTDPVLLTMGPYEFDLFDSEQSWGGSFTPIKAKQKVAYLVRRMSAAEAPNYFWTRDFRTFTRVSDVHPEASYNWYTTALLNWSTPDGTTLQGVLYKPEDFDEKKTYPIIFHYYEGMSNNLNAYLVPGVLDGGLGGCAMNIPAYVSNGYLVFTPDIHYTRGHTGESALASVESAARFLSTKPWVNASKMGVEGCSFGGFETNYIVTHSHLFAAASSSSGPSDAVSDYLGLSDQGRSLQEFFDSQTPQFRIYSSLWDRPDLYLANSAILKADQTTTPLLLMHTKQDGIVPWPQAVEFFTALRRLGKKTWMLQYDDGNHGVVGKSAEDFGVRMMQFFDYYLKDSPPPRWMTQGIPAYKKGIDSALDLDRSGNVP